MYAEVETRATTLIVATHATPHARAMDLLVQHALLIRLHLPQPRLQLVLLRVGHLVFVLIAEHLNL